MAQITECRTCRACGSRLSPDWVFSLGMMPVVAFPETPDAPAFTSPVNLLECPACSLVQLQHTVDPDLLFRKFWYRSNTTCSMKSALADVVQSANQLVRIEPDDAVLDIGTNDGTLLEFYPPSVTRVGFEPALDLAMEASHKGLAVIPEFFERRHLLPEWSHRFKAVFAISMFYDVSGPGEFLDCVRAVLHPEGVFIIQMNYLGSMLRNFAADNIVQEHLCYYSALSFQRLAKQHGLNLFRVEENEVNGGSIRLFLGWDVSCGTGVTHSSQVDAFLEAEKEYLGDSNLAWSRFQDGLEKISLALRRYLRLTKLAGKKLAICGASTRGLTLLHFLGLGKEVFSLVGDRDPHKVGRYYGFTGIPIVSEEEARQQSDVLLVLPWHFVAEITAREQPFLERGGELVFPLPYPRVVSQKGELRL